MRDQLALYQCSRVWPDKVNDTFFDVVWIGNGFATTNSQKMMKAGFLALKMNISLTDSEPEMKCQLWCMRVESHWMWLRDFTRGASESLQLSLPTGSASTSTLSTLLGMAGQNFVWTRCVWGYCTQSEASHSTTIMTDAKNLASMTMENMSQVSSHGFQTLRRLLRQPETQGGVQGHPCMHGSS